MANPEINTGAPDGLRRIKGGFVADGIYDRVTRINGTPVQPVIIVNSPNTPAERSHTIFRPVRTPIVKAK